MLLKRKAYYFLIGFLYFFVLTVSAQDQKAADSLLKIYKADTVKGEAKLELLRNLAFNELKDLQQALHYAEELIRLSR